MRCATDFFILLTFYGKEVMVHITNVIVMAPSVCKELRHIADIEFFIF